MAMLRRPSLSSSSLLYKKSFCCKTTISTQFPYFFPLWAPFKIPQTKAILTHLNIYLFDDIENNPEMSFLSLLSLTPFSDYVPPTEGGGHDYVPLRLCPLTEGRGHIVFGADPVRIGVRVRVASFRRDIF